MACYLQLAPPAAYRVPTNILNTACPAYAGDDTACPVEEGDWRDKHGYFFCNQEKYYSLLQDSRFF